MLEKLSSGLRNIINKITKSGYLDKSTVEELCKEMHTTLMAGDVNAKLATELTEKIKKRALNEKPPAGMTPKEHIVRIVYEELVNFLGKKPEVEIKPQRILFVGLYGSGKTTSIGKIGKFYQKKGLKVAIVGCDVHRPAAMQQVEQVAGWIKVPFYAPKDNRDPIDVAKKGLEQFDKKYDVIIFDASGRSSLDPVLAEELRKLGEVIKADEVLLTIPADLGQAAKEQAEGFKKLVGITGVFITKLDATAKGGGALTACAVTGAPVKFIGIGERLDAIEIFDPERFVSRLLGFGDLQSLLEKIKEADFNKESAEKIISGKFTMNEFMEQLEAMGKMGSLSSIIENIPGLGGMKLPKHIDLSKEEGKMKKWKFIIQSMTKAERDDPETIDASRIRRIAKGSGTQETEVRELLKQYEQAKKMMKMVSGGMGRGPLAKLTRKFRGS